MENLPVGVVGNILSHISAARDVVLASATCRKWREAFHKHLHVLSFRLSDWHGFHDLSSGQVEILITRTIFQTKALQSLTIALVGAFHELSASVVMSWLLYTRESLRELHYDVHTDTDLNVVGILGRGKLEKLILGHDVIEQVDPNYHRFASLRSLSLSSVHISELDLSLLLASCLKLESLELTGLVDLLAKLEVRAPNLRRFYIEKISLDKLVLELDSIECLHLRDCNLEYFKVVGKGCLKKISFDNVDGRHLEICDSAENLEAIDIKNLLTPQSEFYQLISKSFKLRTLRLWDVGFSEWTQGIDLEMIALCYPQLSHLSLGCDLSVDELVPYCFPGSARLENVVYLKVGWSNTLKLVRSNTLMDEFLDLVEVLLERCPGLKKLVIDGVISGFKDHEDWQVLSRFTTSIVRITKKYIDLNVQFEFGS